MTHRIFYLFIIFMAACTPPTEHSSNSELANENTMDSGQTVKQADKVAQVNEIAESNGTSNEKSVVGKWAYYEPSLKMNLTLNLNSDGTFKQRMGDQLIINGTWEKIDETTLKITSEMQKNSSNWKLKEHTDDKLSICWNPDSPTPKTILFERAK
jgi:hypothetical protein